VTEHPNVALVKRLFDAFATYDIPGIIGAIPERAVWTFPGTRSQLAGRHRGREAIVKFLTKVMVLSSGTFSLELHDIMASDEGVVALFTGTAKRGGKKLNNPTALHVNILNGQIVEFREYVWDLEHVEDFWA